MQSDLSGALATELELKSRNVEHFRLGMGGRVDYPTRSTNTFLLGRGNVGLVVTNRSSNSGLVHQRQG